MRLARRRYGPPQTGVVRTNMKEEIQRITVVAMGERAAQEPMVASQHRRMFGNWGAVTAAAVAGLATSLVMATLGTAIGVGAGVRADSVDRGTSAAFGVGAGVWLIVSAIVVGVVAGTML